MDNITVVHEDSSSIITTHNDPENINVVHEADSAIVVTVRAGLV